MPILDQYGNPVVSGQPAAPDFRQIATASPERDITRAYASDILDWEDDLIQSREASLTAYRRLLSDGQVQSVLQQRRNAIVSREWAVKPGGTKRQDKRAADWLKEQLGGLRWDGVAEKAHYGVWYGYMVAEMLNAKDGSTVGIEAIKVRNRERFRFGSDGTLRLLTPSDMVRGEVMPPQKFWTFSTGTDHDDDPYGKGLAHWCYWPVFFKRHGLAYWLRFLERWAQPIPWGKYRPGTPAHEQAKLLQTLYAMATDSAVITPEDVQVELLEAKRNGQSDYDSFADRMDSYLSKVILSQTMTTDDGSSLSQGEVHERVAEAVQKADADLICSSFNDGPVEWYTAWNFPGAAAPQVWYDFEEADNLTERSENDTRVYTMGYKPTPEYIKEHYGEGWVEREVTPPVEAASNLAAGGDGQAQQRRPVPSGDGQPAQFADPDELEVSPGEAFAAHVEQHADPVVADWIEQARTMLGEVGSLAEFAVRLAEIYPNLRTEELAAALGDGLAAATAAGRYEVREGK